MILHPKLPSVPWGFQDEFVRAGWRGVERAYGASTDLLHRWIALSGREQLYRRRAEYIRSRAGKAVDRPRSEAPAAT